MSGLLTGGHVCVLSVVCCYGAVCAACFRETAPCFGSYYISMPMACRLDAYSGYTAMVTPLVALLALHCGVAVGGTRVSLFGTLH